jgi:hypothetical protein
MGPTKKLIESRTVLSEVLGNSIGCLADLLPPIIEGKMVASCPMKSLRSFEKIVDLSRLVRQGAMI